MAFGFPASYSTRVELTGNRTAARNAIESTLETMGWEYSVQDPDTVVAKVPMSGMSWGETMTLSLAEGSLDIRSACYIQVIDWGKNRRNVDQFLRVFSSRELLNIKVFTNEPVYLDEAGATPLERLLKDDPSETIKVEK